MFDLLIGSDSIPLWTAVTAVASILAAIASLIAAVVTGWYAFLTRKLYLLQASPKVIVYSKPDIDRQTIIMLIIENVGNDVAKDVRFFPSRPIPKKAWGISIDDAPEAQCMISGPLIDGIPSLGPGDSRRITWGQYGGLAKAIGDNPIEIKIEYLFDGKKIESSSLLELDSFLENDASESVQSRKANSLVKIASALHDIEKRMQQLVVNKRV